MAETTSESASLAAVSGTFARFTSALLNHPKGVAWLAAFFSVGIIVLQSAQVSDILLLPLALLIGVLVGAAFWGFKFRGQIEAALEVISDDHLSGATQAKIPDTGISDLDHLLNTYARRIAHLFKTIEELGEEAEMLVERYQLLTENLAAAIVIRDASGKITYCSPYTEVLTGYPLNEIYQTSDDFFLDIVHEEDREIFTRALKVTIFGDPFQFRYRIYHNTGIEIWVETRTVPVMNEEGEITSSLSISLDVTGTVRYQRQVEEKNRELEDFTYMVSHDLKAPIVTIKGMAAIVDEEVGDAPEDIREAVTHIGDAARRLERLISGVIEYSRINLREHTPEEVDLKQVVQEVTNDLKTQIRESDATIEVAEELPPVIADRVKVYQIFSNLLGNSIKYRDPLRPLKVTVTSLPSEKPRTVAIAVKDNGRGIPAERLEAIFRPFQRAHGNEIEGSGIGLACVQKLLSKLGGSISVDSKEGAGSTFVVTFRKTA